ncbi:DUF58 domain-containing protein [Marinobacter nanhaiticus D15-8W]|uniref:DUF58 domain-containing protein n=1 Tax=Marinobacter nanhaiticus D15-8W TaxID=626887 RepID=N6WTA4_9GAMM|nr:DUF58 domain-containing protein [Marinobacter nanhaiticus D15-8W]
MSEIALRQWRQLDAFHNRETDRPLIKYFDRFHTFQAVCGENVIRSQGFDRKERRRTPNEGNIRRRWRGWVDRRIPLSDEQQFTQKNIFILPSGAGLVFGLLLLVMLMTGINYQNSLIYLLTFMLGALFVAAMHQTHRNLAGLRLSLVSAGEGFPGDHLTFRIRATAEKDAFGIQFISPEGETRRINVVPGEIGEFELPVPARQRGPVPAGRIQVETRFPFGLLKAWSWMRPGSTGVCYPRPVTPPYETGGEEEGVQASQPRKSDDLSHADLRPWRQGDLSQRVLWKRFARTGEMTIADWEGESGEPVWLDFNQFPGADRELRLSYLAALVESRSRAGQVFGLRIPGLTIEPDQGSAHRSRCLRALGLCGFEKHVAEAGVAAAAGGESVYARAS